MATKGAWAYRRESEQQGTRRKPVGREARTHLHTPKMGKRKWTRSKRGGIKKKKTRVLLENWSVELDVIALGLKYDKDLDKFEAYIDLQKFVRKMNVKKFFLL